MRLGWSGKGLCFSLWATLAGALACSDGSAARPDVARDRDPARTSEDAGEPEPEPEPEPRAERDAGEDAPQMPEPSDEDAGSTTSDGGDTSDASSETEAGVDAPANEDAGTPDASGAGPRYATDIAPILRAHCTLCHVAGGPGPFPLTDFSDVSQYAEEIGSATADRTMPPCEEPSDTCGLSDGEITLIGRWVQAGAPR